MSDEYPLLITALSSIIGGTIGRLVTHPLDTIKSKLQIQQSISTPEFLTIREAIKHTLLSEGTSGLYRGLPITLLGSIPAICLYFSTYEYSKQTLLQYPKLAKYDFLSFLLSGMLAETAACSIFVPIDVIKERLQVQSNLKLYKYNGGIDATKVIFEIEGVRGIYKAFGATLASFGPFSALYFTLYEYFKRIAVGNEKEISFGKSLVCASAAGSMAAWVTNPLDMAKVRMQVVRVSRASKNEVIFNYRNMFHGVYMIASKEGYSALFEGAFARVLFHTPCTAIIMGVTEASRVYFMKIR